ncbi:hypothetical protein GCM10009784_27880 [Arthrobacter parietis]|uniref:Uncharacterized protein n=1 Tax=Arthrobacter parietis TaxID=271434 RepID=A0ABN3AZR2_9MICC
MIVSSLTIPLVIAGHNSASSTQEFKFRPRSDKPLNLIQHLDNVPTIPRNQTHANGCAAVEILRTDFGS